MNAVGMLIDTSHAGMQTMADAIAHSRQPIIVSHTCCERVNSHVRNTTDENLTVLADRGGVVGICQIRNFVTPQTRDNLEHYFDHIDHAVKVAGVDHVCIGSDRDHRVMPDTQEEIDILIREEGAQFSPEHWPLYLTGLNGPRRMEAVFDGIVRRGYAEDQVEKIVAGNLYRLYRDVIWLTGRPHATSDRVADAGQVEPAYLECRDYDRHAHRAVLAGGNPNRLPQHLHVAQQLDEPRERARASSDQGSVVSGQWRSRHPNSSTPGTRSAAAVRPDAGARVHRPGVRSLLAGMR